MDVSTEGFRREMQKLDDLGLGDYVGYFTRTDAKLPEKPEDRIPGEYYVDAKGRPVRYMPSLKPPLQQPQDTGFKVEVKPKKTK